jgi:DNA-binding IclR family transcriptional regulator
MSSDLRVVPSLMGSSFGIVELLANQARSMRLSEIADALDLPRSGTHRVLTMLCGLGWLEQDPVSEFYRLSLKLSILGHRFLVGSRIPDLCQPVLERLAQQCRELVRLAVVEGEDLTTIAYAQGAQGSLICNSRAFPKLPLHVTASGKAWLATLPVEQALKLALAAGWGRPGEFGPNALRSVDRLTKEIETTRKRGFGVALEEAEPGVGALAAMVCPDGGEGVAALAIVVPTVRLDKARIATLGPLVQAAAEELAVLWPLSAVHRAANEELAASA